MPVALYPVEEIEGVFFENIVEPDSTYIHPYQSGFDVGHYAINITLNHKKKQLAGHVILSGRVTGAFPQFVFNLYNNMQIDSLFVNGRAAAYSRSGNKVFISRFANTGDSISVEAYYRGQPRREGFASFVFGELNDVPLIHTLNEPYYASTWLFCDDDPADKALADITITADSSLQTVSNGVLAGVSDEGPLRSYHWRSTYPIATYLICFYTSRYKHFREYYVSAAKDSLPLDYYVSAKHFANAEKQFRGHPDMIRVLSSLFGEYPFMKEKYGVAEFLWYSGAMEHQTITGVSSTMLGADYDFEDVYVHELAHHWWGNAVTLADWKDIWLNEGFASYAEALYYEKSGDLELFRNKMNEFSDFDDQGPLYNPSGDLFSPLVYHKGAWVLHMLRYEMGDTAFFSALRNYYETYKYRNATTENFIAVFESAAERPLRQFFSQWVFGANGRPQLECSWIYSDAGASTGYVEVTIRQKSEYLFDIPLEVELTGFPNVRKKIRLSAAEQTFRIAVNAKPIAVAVDPDKRMLKEITAPQQGRWD